MQIECFIERSPFYRCGRMDFFAKILIDQQDIAGRMSRGGETIEAKIQWVVNFSPWRHFTLIRSCFHYNLFTSEASQLLLFKLYILSRRQHSECHGHLGATVQPSSQQKHLECVSRSCLMGYEALSYFFYKLSTRMRRF